MYTGHKVINVHDELKGISFPVLVHYPTDEVSKHRAFGPYEMEVSVDAEPTKGTFPLVIISHGNSGSYLLYRTISNYLAQQGFIVACIEHYGNNRKNNELSESTENLTLRPRHVSLTIDAVLEHELFMSSTEEDAIAMIGHSFGGYTALAVAGGTPWTVTREKVKVAHDDRIRTIVLMAPAAGYFMPPSALSSVSVPILLYTGEHDHITPRKWTSDVIVGGVPDPSKVTHIEVANAGHFSFLSPFPAALAHASFVPSVDPDGFDRVAFHHRLRIEIYSFLVTIFDTNEKRK